MSQSLPLRDVAAPVSRLRLIIGQAKTRVRAVVSAQSPRDLAQRNAFVAFGVRVVSAALLYFSQVILARLMGTFEYGVFVFVWTWVLVLGGLSHLGFGVTMIRLLPEYQVRGQLALMRGLLSTSRRLALSVGALCTVLGALALSTFGERLAHHTVLPLFLALICLPGFALTDLQDGIGRARGWIGIALVPPYILRPLLLLGGTLAAHFAGLPMDARTAAGAAIVATYGTLLVQSILLNRQLGRDVPPGPKAFAPNVWAKTAWPLFVIYAAELVIQNVDVLVISAVMTPVEVGKYFAAAKTMSLVMFVHYAVGSAVANRFAALNAKGDAEELKRFVADAVRWTFWPSLAAALAILALGRPLLWLFSPTYVDAYPVMLILVGGFLVRASMGPAEFLLNMLGQQRISACVQVATAVASLVLNLILVPKFGLMGAATATAMALVGAAVANAYIARTRLGLNISVFSAWFAPVRPV